MIYIIDTHIKKAKRLKNLFGWDYSEIYFPIIYKARPFCTELPSSQFSRLFEYKTKQRVITDIILN